MTGQQEEVVDLTPAYYPRMPVYGSPLSLGTAEEQLQSNQRVAKRPSKLPKRWKSLYDEQEKQEEVARQWDADGLGMVASPRMQTIIRLC